jgi:putative peptidoglycan lipid II flippase
MGMQWPFLARYGMRYRPRFRVDSGLRQMVRLAEGAFISAMVTPLNSLIDRALASFLFPGAIAALNYAFLLFLLPASLCVVPLSTVLLTDLASLYHQGDIAALQRRARFGLRLVLCLTVPIAIGGVWLAEPLARLVYEYGRFRATDTLLTSQALQAYVLGLPFYGATHVLSRCFYALQDTMTPAMVNLGALVLNIICDLVFMHFCGHWGIALASTVVMLATTIMLYCLFLRRCLRHYGIPPASRILTTREK